MALKSTIYGKVEATSLRKTFKKIEHKYNKNKVCLEKKFEDRYHTNKN